MADIRINALATTATTPASDDYLALDGAAQGTRKILATNIANNVTDVILGSSGPSVKSTLSARAPRQGLVFDGSLAEATFTIPAFGTSPYTVQLVARQTSAATQRVFWAAANGAFIVYVGSNGSINWGISGSATVATSAGVFAAGVNQDVVITRVSTAANDFKIYVNGVVVYTGTDANNYTTASNSLSDSTADAFSGTLLGRVYNRALSASEVVALYESGAPAGADYNSASNTAINTNTAVDGVAGNNTFAATAGGSFTGASATGFTAVSGGGAYAAASFQPNFTVQPGQIIRVTYTATVNSGTVLASLMNSSVSSISSSHTVTTGTRTVEFVATAASTSARVIFGSSGASACNFSVSSVSVVRSGLLLAPDAAQAGGGLVWYDTSGNAANITLPASGVSWNVPFAGYVTAPTTTNLTLAGGSSGSNIVLGQGASGTISAKSNNAIFGLLAAGGSFRTFNTAGDTAFASYGNDGDGRARFGALTNTDVDIIQNNTVAMRLTATNRNFLVGTTTDSANGKLQLATHTTSAGGIGFGTDISLYRATVAFYGFPAVNAALFRSSGSNLIFSSTNYNHYIGQKGDSGDFFISATDSITLQTRGNASNGTTALTIDSSQNATFAGDIRFSSANAFDIGQTGTRVRTAFIKTLVLTSGAPAAANSTGTAGTVTWDANYLYVCTATDTWKRVAIATWP